MTLTKQEPQLELVEQQPEKPGDTTAAIMLLVETQERTNYLLQGIQSQVAELLQQNRLVLSQQAEVALDKVNKAEPEKHKQVGVTKFYGSVQEAQMSVMNLFLHRKKTGMGNVISSYDLSQHFRQEKKIPDNLKLSFHDVMTDEFMRYAGIEKHGKMSYQY